MQHPAGQPFTAAQRALIDRWLHTMPAAGRLSGTFQHDHDDFAETLELSVRFTPRHLADFIVVRDGEGDAVRADMLRGHFPSVVFPNIAAALDAIMSKVQDGLPRRHPLPVYPMEAAA